MCLARSLSCFSSSFNLRTSSVVEDEPSSSVSLAVSSCSLASCSLVSASSVSSSSFFCSASVSLSIKSSHISFAGLTEGVDSRNTLSSSISDNFSEMVGVSSITTWMLRTSRLSWSLPSISCLTSSVEPVVGSSKLSAICFKWTEVSLRELSGRSFPRGAVSTIAPSPARDPYSASCSLSDILHSLSNTDNRYLFTSPLAVWLDRFPVAAQSRA